MVETWDRDELQIRSADEGRSLAVRRTASLVITTVRGDVSVQNTTGSVVVTSVRGEIDISDASGTSTATASSQGDDVRVSRALRVHSGSGDLRLTDISAHSVRAETQDGDVYFSGSLSSGGRAC